MTQLEQQKSTHLFFDGEKIIISPDIMPVFTFLMEIEKEIKNILEFNAKLDSIKESHLEMMNFVVFLSDIIKKNNLDFKYNFKEHPEKIADKLTFSFPVRSQMIVLFASLEVIYSLHTAYDKETDNQDELRRNTMDNNNLKKFVNSFMLTDQNEYYKKNKVRFSKLDSTKIRDLRNSLTHFFSLSGGLFVIPEILKEKAQGLEKILKQNKHGDIVSISPIDLNELIKSANILRMKEWSNDFQNDSVDFKRKIQFVINIVKKEGAIIVLEKDLNIK